MVSITSVTCNSARYLQECFAAVEAQDCRDLEVVIFDNGSEDGTREILRQVESGWRVIYHDKNIGFAGGQNRAIAASRGEWVLCLNPDLIVSPDFVSQLLAAAEQYPDAGIICGKLLRWNPDHEPHKTNIIDSTGMYFTPNMRHLDRGAEEIDRSQYDRAQYVFGASGAAVFYRRDFINDVSVESEFFDEDFFTWREDADLAWRAQVMGWKCVYTPKAVGWHVRRVTPERREKLPLLVNWHSVKNRFLMRGKNASGWLCRRLFFPVLWRDLMTFGYAIVRDRRLWSATIYWWKVRDSIRRKRAIIQSKRRVSDRDLIWWFSNTPRAIDAPEVREQSAISSQHSANKG